MENKLSRREFLKLGVLSLTGLAFGRFSFRGEQEFRNGLYGRVAYPTVSVLDAPRFDAKTVDYRWRDELLNIYYQSTPLTGPAYNPLWYRVWRGWVHSAFIQPVQVRLNLTADDIPAGGQISELTVPYSRPYKFSQSFGWEPIREFYFYYESTHWVTGIVSGPDKQPWYQITDELSELIKYYVPAEHLRLIPDVELTPLSPDVPPGEKRIEVSLQWQTLVAYEGNNPVFQTQVSTGINSPTPAGLLPTKTPEGLFNIQIKLPSKNMDSNRLTDTLDDLALRGVPWTAFFDLRGYAIHGTFWHNNFGWPMSKGCINMRNDDAKWLFRWMTPVNTPQDWEKKGFGTQVVIS